MKKEHVTLTAEERATLLAVLAKGSLKVKTFRRATGLLELDRVTAARKKLNSHYTRVNAENSKYKET